MDGLIPGDELAGAVFVVASPHKLADINPFGDLEALCTQVSKEINPTQLTDEISQETGVTVQICAVNPNPSFPVGPDNPSKLYVQPVVDVEQVDKIVKEHIPDSDYGLSPENRRRHELIKKLSDGQALSSGELMEALQLALRGSTDR